LIDYTGFEPYLNQNNEEIIRPTQSLRQHSFCSVYRLSANLARCLTVCRCEWIICSWSLLFLGRVQHNCHILCFASSHAQSQQV